MKATRCSSIAGAALAGFVSCVAAQPAAHPPPTGSPTICNSGICKIDITVNDCGAIGGIKVNPDHLGMAGTSGPAVIHWKIVTPGFSFSPDGRRLVAGGPGVYQFWEAPEFRAPLITPAAATNSVPGTLWDQLPISAQLR